MEKPSCSLDTSAGADGSDGRLVLNTTDLSLLHRLLAQRFVGRPFSNIYLYLLGIAVTFLPLVAAALTSDLPLTSATPPHTLPFLRDWNMLCMVLLSFPCVLILTVTDEHVLAAALNTVQSDSTITISQADAADLAARCVRMFRVTNVAAQLLALAAGALAVFIAYRNLLPPTTGHWIAHEGRLLGVGYVYLYCVFLFYGLVTIYCVRNLATSVLLRGMVDRVKLQLLPLHPDGAGGLRPVGLLGLRNQYVLTVLGINLVLLAVTTAFHLTPPPAFWSVIAALCVLYAVLGPAVFLAPLMAFRDAMLRTKRELMTEVAQRLRLELQRLRSVMRSQAISKDDEELIDRLRKLGGLIRELPVWPFDAGTMRRFLTAYISPVLTSLAIAAANSLAKWIGVI
jgi:hypothetical protein